MRLIVAIAFLFHAANAFAQYSYPYEEIRLDKPGSFKEVEPLALAAAKFLLSTPYTHEDKPRERAFQFLLKWTGEGKLYDFRLSGVILEFVDDKELMKLFVAAMTKFCIENPELGNNSKLIEKNSVQLVLDYCNDPANKFQLKKKARRKLSGV